MKKLARSDVAIHLILPYTLAPLLYLIFNKLIYNHVGGLFFAILDYWGPSDYVYKIWLSLVQDKHEDKGKSFFTTQYVC